MSQVKPLHPCVSWPPPKATCMQKVTCSLRHFYISNTPDQYPYHVSRSGDKFRIPFYEIRGQGPPPTYDPDFGSPGDVYLDLKNTDAYVLYWKTMTDWVQWDAATTCSTKHKPPITSLSRHPYFEGLDRFLWCDGRLVSWCSRSTIKKKRRKMQEDGMYHRKDGVAGEVHARAVTTDIVKRMVECGEQRKVKRGMGDIETADDDVGHMHKKMKTDLQTPSSSDSISGASSLASLPQVNDTIMQYSPPPDSSVHRFLLEERKITKELREANQRLVAENAKLREAHSGRSFSDIGTSSDDLDSSGICQSEITGEDVTFPASVLAGITGVDGLKALGIALNEAHLQTQRNRLEMEAKCSRANNEKDRVEQRLSQTLEELEHQEQATKAIQSLYDESDEKVDEIESRLLCVLNELSESKTACLRAEMNYSKLLQQMTRAKEALNMFEASGNDQ